MAVTADLSALSDHVGRLADLVITSVSHSNESANITLAVIGTLFLPLTFIAGEFRHVSTGTRGTACGGSPSLEPPL